MKKKALITGVTCQGGSESDETRCTGETPGMYDVKLPRVIKRILKK